MSYSMVPELSFSPSEFLNFTREVHGAETLSETSPQNNNSLTIKHSAFENITHQSNGSFAENISLARCAQKDLFGKSLSAIDCNRNMTQYLNGTNEVKINVNGSANDTGAQNLPEAVTTPVVPVWERGIISYHVFVRTMKYFRWSMVVPCLLSLVSTALTVFVMGVKSFRLSGKEMAIAFNLIEGIKCSVFIFNRAYKAYISDQTLTFRSTYSQIFIYLLIWFPDAIGRIGILLNCLITIERFFILAFPIKYHNKRVIEYPKVCIGIITVSMLLYQTNPLILFFKYGRPYLDYTKTFYSDDLTSLIANINPRIFGLYISLHLAGAAMFRYIPTIVTIIFNTMTVVKLYQHSKQRKSLVNNSDQFRSRLSMTTQTNRMLIGSSCMFALLVTLKPLNRSLRLAIPTYGEGQRNTFLYHIINDAFVFLDNSIPLVNIIVYSSLSSQFFRRLKALFRRCCRKGRQQASVGSISGTLDKS